MELSTISDLFLALISLLILVSAISQKLAMIFENRQPPGPWRLPFVGSIHHMLTSQPQVALRDLAQKHGPVMYLRLGQVDTVVISSLAAAQEVLRENDLSFASRPNLLGAEIFFYGNLDIAFAPYGAYWRALRKLCTLELLSPRKVRQLAPIRDHETMSLIGEVRAACGEPVNIGRLLVSCANSIAGLATFGHRCSSERKEQLLSAMDVVLSNNSGFCVSDLFPSLWFVDVVTGARRRFRKAHQKLEDVLDKIIIECEARQNERNAKKFVGEDVVGEDDLMSVMLRIKDEGELEFPFNTKNIKAIIVGLETTSVTAEWVMSELVRNPEVMTKAQAEVRRTFNKKRPCDHESHMDDLWYTRMVIKETLRLHPPIPLLLPRLCRETCDIAGFKVTKGSRVIINAWAMTRCPEYWDDANKFRPERFENSMTDYKGTQFHYLPFGSGRRICPGLGFGLATLELMIARLLYYFDWGLLDGQQLEDLDMGVTVGVTARKTNQLHLCASPYDSGTEI